MSEQIIHIQWEGPHTLNAITSLNGACDKGLYQVYAHHPVYGQCLVYIGKTCTTFAERICQSPPQEQWEGGSENDPRKVEYYVGRLKWAKTPERDQWDREIEQAEALLIHAHGPAYNSTNIKAINNEEAVKNIRVLDWGAVCSLHREVSGLMWMAAAPARELVIYGRPPAEVG